MLKSEEQFPNGVTNFYCGEFPLWIGEITIGSMTILIQKKN